MKVNDLLPKPTFQCKLYGQLLLVLFVVLLMLSKRICRYSIISAIIAVSSANLMYDDFSNAHTLWLQRAVLSNYSLPAV